MVRNGSIAIWLLLVLLTADAPGRTWTSASGALKMDAELVQKRADGTVVLKRADGTVLELKPEKFSAADQDYIRQWTPGGNPPQGQVKPENKPQPADGPADSESVLSDEEQEAVEKIKSAQAKAAVRAYQEKEGELSAALAAKQKDYREKLAVMFEDALKEAAGAGNLDDAVALRSAIQSLRKGEDPPAEDEPVEHGDNVAASVRLSTLPVTGISDVLNATLPNHLWAKISLGGKQIDDGISMRPRRLKTALVTFRLNGKFESIAGKAGIDDDVPIQSAMPVIFALLGDKKVVWKSQPLQKSGEFEEFDVKIPKVRVLTLVVQTGGSSSFAHARWGDVELVRVPKKPPKAAP